MKKPTVHITRFLFFVLIAFLSKTASGQSMSGYVVNKNSEVLPYVNIYVQQEQSGVTTDEKGYFYLRLDPGEYDLIISYIGYETKKATIIIDTDEEINFELLSSEYELDQITIQASKKDPAYGIIANAIKAKEKYKTSIQSYRAQVYVKAFEEYENKKKQKIEDKKPEGLDVDPFKIAEEKKQREFSKLNLLESQVQLNYQYPNRFKEEKTAYKVYGSKEGLYVPSFHNAHFDFYDNLVKMFDISNTPIISPIANNAILSYKYKLIESKKESDGLVHKIKVTPRKTGNATVSGFIYIIEDLWNIKGIDFDMPKNSMKLFDKMNIKLDYNLLENEVWFASRQEMKYESRFGKNKKYEGSTLLDFKDIEIDFVFPDKFFGPEVSVITQEAYDRDSTYWNQNRPEKLSEKQQDLVIYKDSLETIYNSDEYKDSIQRQFNKLELLELAFEGIGFQFHRRKESYYIPALAELVGFHVVGGLRWALNGSYYRRFDNEMIYRTFDNFSQGIKNKDINFRSSHWLRYDPIHLGDITFRVGRNFRAINLYDAYLNYLKSSSYFLQDAITIGHSYEVLNGLFVYTGFDWNDRRDITHLNSESVITEIVEEGEAIAFDPYKTFNTTLSISYTPAQKYISEPNRKIIIGSKWPTFTLRHNKGWKGIFSSSVDFDLLEFTIEQDIIFGTLGNSKYRFITGRFLNSKNIPFIDIKRIAESNPILYAEPLYSFQSLDTTVLTKDAYYEMHWLHHFNGSLLNNIPLINKSKISVVAGANALYVAESKLYHQEILAGIERIFKIGPRRRLRLGFYGVLASSLDKTAVSEYKISFDIIDTWKRDWSF